jgi:hypothetical protein
MFCVEPLRTGNLLSELSESIMTQLMFIVRLRLVDTFLCQSEVFEHVVP